MELSSGTRLGAYRITGFVASGGMGGVYEAVHTELGRRVAIKVIGPEIADDPRALRRFRREARSASRLNHPHICTVHDFGEADGTAYLVLEYLEGETLAKRLERGRPRLRDTLRHGAQIAEALHHAHERGFVHRDLKPGNVMLTSTGAKVLDFGLVKRSAAEQTFEDPADDATELSSLTRQGMIVGTLPYMAPEQVEGGAVDARTDIYGLGAVLFEMVTGRPPARGKTPAALIADILQGDHTGDLAGQADAPEPLAHVIRRCLRKDPADRWQDARDVAIELRWIANQRSGETASVETERSEPRRRHRAWLAGATAALLLSALGVWLSLREDATPAVAARPLQFGISAPPGVTFTEGARNVPAVSPDGDRIAFVGTDAEGKSAVWIHSLDAGRTQRVSGAGGPLNPFWGPDGEAIGFFSREGLQTTRLPDGPVETVASFAFESGGAGGGAWSRRDGRETFLFAPGLRSGLYRATPGEDEAELVTSVDAARGERGHLWPHFLPDGRRFLYFVDSAVDSVRGLYLGSLSDPRGRRLVDATASGIYASGYLLYVRDGALLAHEFDPGRGAATGGPLPLVDSVATTYAGQGAFSASNTGVLAYWSDVSRDVNRLVWLDSAGRSLEVVGPPRHYRNPSLSAAGTHVAVDVFDGADRDLMVIELRDGRERRLRDLAPRVRDPVWAPDGRQLAYAAERTGGWVLERLDVHSAAPPVTIVASESDKFPIHWSPDGRWISYVERRDEGTWDVLAVEPEPGSEPVFLFDSEYAETSGRFSPNGTKIAYESDLSGRIEIYAEPYPPTGLRCQISSGGGLDAHWDPEGDRLYYLSSTGRLVSVEVELEPDCAVSAPRPLFETAIETPYTARNHYEVSPDGDRFLFNLPADDPRTQTIAVIVNWPARLRADTP